MHPIGTIIISPKPRKVKKTKKFYNYRLSFFVNDFILGISMSFDLNFVALPKKAKGVYEEN